MINYEYTYAFSIICVLPVLIFVIISFMQMRDVLKNQSDRYIEYERIENEKQDEDPIHIDTDDSPNQT